MKRKIFNHCRTPSLGFNPGAKIVFILLLGLSFGLFPAPALAQKKLQKHLQSQFDAQEWTGLSLEEVEEKILNIELATHNQDYLNLLEAKNYIINGQVKRAQFYLEKWRPLSLGAKMVRKRYLALVYFIQDKYVELNEVLEDKFFYNISFYPQICMLKFISAVVSKDQKKIKNEYFNCGQQNARFSNSDQVWLESIYKFATRDKTALRGQDLQTMFKGLEDANLIRIWLKLGLYTNRENYIEPLLQTLPNDVFQSHKTRELLGLIYYRLGQEDKAREYIEDLTGVNAENIKGNLEMVKGQNELAFGHFKLALLKKENSKNAIERALPLSWLLGQFKEGLTLLSRIVDSETDIRKKLLLNTAFQVRLKNYLRSGHQMQSLKKLFHGELPKEASIMGNYVSVMNEDKNLAKDYASVACRKGDGLSCWFLMQNIIWEDLTKSIKRDEYTYSDTEINLAKLKEAPEENALQETILIDQKDIEELDGIEVRLLGDVGNSSR